MLKKIMDILGTYISGHVQTCTLNHFLQNHLNLIWDSRKAKVSNRSIWSTRIKLAQQKLQFPSKIGKPSNLQLKFHRRKYLKTLMC